MVVLLLFSIFGLVDFTLAQNALSSPCDVTDYLTNTNSSEFWEGVTGQENVVKLTDDTFYEFIKERSWVFYYNTWCPTFQGQKQSIANIASELVKINYPGGLGAFECLGRTNDKAICMEYRKKCWHYDVYYYAGNRIESYPYDTKRTEQTAVSFMKAHIDKPDERIIRGNNC